MGLCCSVCFDDGIPSTINATTVSHPVSHTDNLNQQIGMNSTVESYPSTSTGFVNNSFHSSTIDGLSQTIVSSPSNMNSTIETIDTGFYQTTESQPTTQENYVY